MATVLIAEDDLMIADMTEEILVEYGYDVCGIARTVEQAVDLARHHRPDMILLDLRLANGGMGTEVVAQLDSVNHPGVLYVTGNSSQVVLGPNDGDACLSKPFRSKDLIRGLEIVTHLIASGTAQLPFPSGFHLLRPPGSGIRVATI